MAVTTDWQMEFGSLLIGEETDYDIVEIEGLLDHPEVRSSDHERLRRHGLAPGDDFTGGRVVIVSMDVYGADTDAVATAVSNLQQAFRTGDEAALSFQIPGVAGGNLARVNARVRNRSLVIDRNFTAGIPRAVVQFYATDPRIYTEAQPQVSTDIFAASGGITFNVVGNFNFPPSTESGTVTATNSGTFTTPTVIRLDGPVTNPSIENLTTDESMSLTITVAEGDYLEIDSAERTILLNGTASRYSALDAGSDWIDLPPGDNELKFRGSSGTTATMTVTWRSAWL